MDWMDNVARYGMLAASDASSRSDEAMELPWLRAMGAAAETVLEERPSVTAPALMQSLKEHLTVRRLVFTPEVRVRPNFSAAHYKPRAPCVSLPLTHLLTCPIFNRARS